jgi:probable HAF family extracellular repeat protein
MKMQRHILTTLLCGISIFSIANTANAILWSAQTSSTVTAVDIGLLQGTSINNAGQVAGTSFVWDPVNGLKELGPLGVYVGGSRGTSINNNGQVTGFSSYLGSIPFHPFFWDTAKGMTDLGTLGGSSAIGNSINDNGKIAGWSETGISYTERAFAWDPVNGMVELATLGGNSRGFGINNAGQVTGYSSTSGYWDAQPLAVIWDTSTGAINNLGIYGIGYDINNIGQVTGKGLTHAFLWDHETGVIDLGTLGGSYSKGGGINDSGQVVGWSHSEDNSQIHAFVYDNGTMYDLNSFVQLATGEYLDNATAINELSQIVATSNRGKTYVITPTETCSPVPVPSSGILFSSSVALLAMLKRRR